MRDCFGIMRPLMTYGQKARDFYAVGFSMEEARDLVREHIPLCYWTIYIKQNARMSRIMKNTHHKYRNVRSPMGQMGVIGRMGNSYGVWDCNWNISYENEHNTSNYLERAITLQSYMCPQLWTYDKRNSPQREGSSKHNLYGVLSSLKQNRKHRCLILRKTDDFTAVELKDLCRVNGLKVSGKKKVLHQRFLQL